MSAGNSAALTESSADMNQGELEEAASAVVVPTGSRRELVASAAAAAGSSALRLLPILAAASIASYFLTILLAGVSGPIAGGIKLIYAGAIAGIVSRTACAPLEMVSTLMMCRGNEVGSMWSELSRAWKTEGMGGLFKGNGANCLKVAPSRGTQFLIYEFMKRQLRTIGWGVAASGSLNAGARLFAGGIAGMVAAAIVYPLEVVKTLRTVYPGECRSIREAASCTIKYGGGLRGLYAGMTPTLVAMFPYVGIEFMVYETLKRRWELAVLGGAPSGTLALLACGALAGAAAQACAHPLDVVRRRMQMSGLKARFDKGDAASGTEEPAARMNLFTGLYSIAKNEGWKTLFRGLGPACFEKVPSTAIGYYIYEALKVAMKVSSV